LPLRCRFSAITPTTHTYTLSLHDALPISHAEQQQFRHIAKIESYASPIRSPVLSNFVPDNVTFVFESPCLHCLESPRQERIGDRSEEHTSELQSRENLVCRLLLEKKNRIV